MVLPRNATSVGLASAGSLKGSVISEITGLIGVFGTVSLVLSIVGMVLIMKHVSKVKEDEPPVYIQGPPPPPSFGGGI